MKKTLIAHMFVALVLSVGITAMAQAQQAPPAASGLPQRFAPIDLTGTWVSVVTEDWQVRMIPPPKGDYESVPLSQAGQDALKRFDVAQAEAAGRACDAYGAPAIMREPGRVRISWQDGNTLKVETDSGEQTRLFHFGAADAAPRAASRQGYSAAAWQYAGGFNPQRAADGAAAGGGRGGGRGGRGGARGNAPTGGKLKVTTTDLSAGLLRKNGVPYSTSTTLTEYYNLLTEPSGTQWIVVTTVVHDPENLLVDYIMSTNFRKEPDSSRWKPRPCSLR